MTMKNKKKSPHSPFPFESASTNDGLPVAPSLGPYVQSTHLPSSALIDGRVIFITVIAVLIALAAAVIAQGLDFLIRFITSISFFGKF